MMAAYVQTLNELAIIQVCFAIDGVQITSQQSRSGITKAEYNTHNTAGVKDPNQKIEASLDLTPEIITNMQIPRQHRDLYSQIKDLYKELGYCY